MAIYKRKRASTSTRSRKASKPSPYTRRKFTARLSSRRNISRIARQVVLQAAESKEVNCNQGKTELNHNTLALVANLNGNSPTYMPTQGNTDNQRNGDRILSRGFKVHVMCGQKYDRPNVTWRIMIVAQKPGAGVLTYNTLFRNVSGNGLLDEINDDDVTVLHQKYWKPAQSTYFSSLAGTEVSREYTFTRKIWIPRKKEYKFSQNGGTVHNDKDIYMYVLAYDAFGSLIADNIAYIQIWTKFLFKDP